jgi:hypothetical protein
MLATILLNGVGTVGVGEAEAVPVPFPQAIGTMPNIVPSNHTVQVTFTNSGGSVTALTVALEGSLDDTNYVTLVTHIFTAGELTAKTSLFIVSAVNVSRVRANVTLLTSTGTTAIYVYHLTGL